MTKWTPDLLKEHYDDRLGSIAHDLEGFPEKYATLEDFKILRSLIEDIRADHVHRREIDEIKEDMHEAAGRRYTMVVAASIMTTLVVAMVGFVWRAQPTHSDIESQIRAEAPWVTDRPAVEARISRLEQRQQAVLTRLAAMDQLDRFFCATRVRAKLPAC